MARARRARPILVSPAVAKARIKYVSGLADHRLSNEDLVEHIVGMVEERAAKIKAQRNADPIRKNYVPKARWRLCDHVTFAACQGNQRPFA